MSAESPKNLADIARLGDPSPLTPSAAEPLPEREHAFVLRVHMADGEKEGTCVCRITGVEDRLRMGRIRARLAGGIPFDFLDAATRTLIDAQAVVAISVIEKPKWFDEVVESRPDVLLAVYEEVQRHDAAYFRSDVPAGGGKARVPMVAVVPVPGAATPPDELRWEARDPARTMGGPREPSAPARR